MTTSAIHISLSDRWCRMLHIGWEIGKIMQVKRCCREQKSLDHGCPQTSFFFLPLARKISEIYKHPSGLRFKTGSTLNQYYCRATLKKQTSIHTHRHFKVPNLTHMVESVSQIHRFDSVYSSRRVNLVRTHNSAATAISFQHNMCDIRSSHGLCWIAMMIHSVVSRKSVTWEVCWSLLLSTVPPTAIHCNSKKQK